MSSLPALPAGAAVEHLSTALVPHEGPVPSSVRAEALRGMEDAMSSLSDIISGKWNGKDVAAGVVVNAVKLRAEIAAVRQTSSVPRDVVEQKLRETAALLRGRLGDELYATIAEPLTAVWDI